MFSMKCQCGRWLKLKVPHLKLLQHCPDCKAPFKAVAGAEPPDGVFRFAVKIVDGPAQVGEQVFLGGTTPLTLGKHSSSDIRLGGKSVSRQHCRFVPAKSGWTVEDTDSRHGLYVNDVLVMSHVLEDADELRIADFKLVVRDTLLSSPGPPPGSETES